MVLLPYNYDYNNPIAIQVSCDSANLFEELMHSTGAIVSGRRMFDVAGAWVGSHPLGAPVFVVTHTIPQEWANDGSPFTFVTDGVESAVRQAKQVPGEKNVGVCK